MENDGSPFAGFVFSKEQHQIWPCLFTHLNYILQIIYYCDNSCHLLTADPVNSVNSALDIYCMPCAYFSLSLVYCIYCLYCLFPNKEKSFAFIWYVGMFLSCPSAAFGTVPPPCSSSFWVQHLCWGHILHTTQWRHLTIIINLHD